MSVAGRGKGRLRTGRPGVPEAAVVKAYASAALVEANARIARQSAAHLREEARLAYERWQSGDISRSDRDEIEIAAVRLELDATAAEAGAQAAWVALELMLGETSQRGQAGLADAIEALAERRPLGGGVAPPGRADSFGADAGLPLPPGNCQASAIGAAQAAGGEAARAAVHPHAAVAADVVTARRAYEEAFARWRRYRDELRPRSDLIRRSVSLAYERGGASLPELLAAQRSDNDIRLAAIAAAGDAAIARAVLDATEAP